MPRLFAFMSGILRNLECELPTINGVEDPVDGVALYKAFNLVGPFGGTGSQGVAPGLGCWVPSGRKRGDPMGNKRRIMFQLPGTEFGSQHRNRGLHSPIDTAA